MSHRKRMLRHGPRTGVLAASISAVIASGGVSSTALGQDDEETQSRTDETVVVTGTRIRRDDYTAVNATTVITADEMRSLGVTSVADMIAQLPANVASSTASTNTDLISGFGLEVANLRGLNTSGGTRTLVLVDGSRFVPTTNTGVVDLNMIPTALVGRIETVTGGASATYGADAMAGVVNVILDNNVEGIRLDLTYGTDNYGDGDQVSLSLGTGFEVLNRRGRVTVGYDHQTTDAIPDCTARDYCARGFGMLQNFPNPGGTGNRPGEPATAGSAFFPGQPQYIITEGMRFTRIPEGMFMNGLDHDAGEVLLTEAEIAALEISGMWDNVFRTAPTLNVPAFGNSTYQVREFGTYSFSADGTAVVPYLSVGPDGQPLSSAEYDYIQARGSGGVTPWGSGALEYANTPLRSANDRDNLFTQFQYDFENGISLTTNLSYSESNSEATQNSQRQSNWAVGCIFPENAFLDPRSGATDGLRALVDQRRVWLDAFPMAVMMVVGDGMLDEYNPFDATPSGGTGSCRPGPYLGQSYLDDDEDIEIYDFPEQIGTTGITKDVSPFTNRFQISENNTTNFRLGARGDIFDGGSWTWDGNLSFGHSEREQRINGQQSNRRIEMALDSVWDDALNQPVCKINSTNLYTGIWRESNLPVGYTAPPFQAVAQDDWTVGEYYTQKWLNFIEKSLGDEGSPELAQVFFDSMAQGCAPANPFGRTLSPEAVAYAWPNLIQGSENDQLSIDLSVSGEIWKGVGAGPFRMAGGVSWRETDSTNYADPNPYTARDFNVRYSDSYSGITEAEDVFVEFDLPLLRDKPGADFLSFNLGYRKTDNTTRREEGLESIVTSKTTRSVDSWKASMVWRPLDILMVRTTRSADTRAPSAEELFSATQPALVTGANRELATPFRANIPGTDVNESLDFYDELGDALGNAGNSRLQEETSTTQTVGLVFTPTELLSGLSASIDYYETDIKGGVDNVSVNQVMQNCAVELIRGNFEFPGDYEFCGNVNFVLDNPDSTQDFILPDLTDEAFQEGINTLWIQAAEEGFPTFAEGEANPFYAFSNVDSVAPSTINSQPFLSRGLDVSISYNTQLGGGGSISARVLVSRALEQRVETGGMFSTSQGIGFFDGATSPARQNAVRDVSGQTGSNGVGVAGTGFLAPLFENYSPTARISGNMFLTYRKNAFSFTGQVRYIGTGKLSNQRYWYGPGDVVSFLDSSGNLLQRSWAPELTQTVSSNDLPSWATLNIGFEYDFSRSRLQMDRFESLRIFVDIDNVGNRVPDFFSGTGAGGVNTTFFNTQGRMYQLGARMQF